MHVLVDSALDWGVARVHDADEIFHIATLALINAIPTYKSKADKVTVRLVSDDYQIDGMGVSASFIKKVYEGPIPQQLIERLNKAVEEADGFFQDKLDDGGVDEAYAWSRENEKGK